MSLEICNTRGVVIHDHDDHYELSKTEAFLNPEEPGELTKEERDAFSPQFDRIIFAAAELFDEIFRLEGLDENSKPFRIIYESLCELIDNAEKHGNQFDIHKKTYVWPEISKTEEAVTIECTITDEGDGFDHEHLRASHEQDQQRKTPAKTYNTYRTLSQNPNQGTGCALFNTLNRFDEVTWNTSGNSITVKKCISIDIDR